MMESARAPSGTSIKSADADAFAVAAVKLGAQRPIRGARLRQITSNLRSKSHDVVELELREYLARYPEDPDALNLLAQTIVRLGRRREATSLLTRCLELAPDFAAARFNYTKLLCELHDYRAALNEIGQLLVRDSRNPLFRQLKANILEAIGENEQSLAICEQLAAENPGRAESWVNYGHALRGMGFQERSAAAYRKAIECHPSFGKAYWSLANMKTIRFSDADMDAMQRHLKRSDISSEDRISLQYALAKAYEDARAYDRSFELYAKANAAMRLRITYDPDTLTSGVAGNKALFTSDFFENRKDAGCEAPDPIFILGRPRSGSTLIEQILCSHSAIEATAELPYITALAARLGGREGADSPVYGTDYLKILSDMAPSALAALGEEYLENAKAHRKFGRPFFIDKKPGNVVHLGMIHLILPNAKIIDARRHPVACCLSQFKHYSSKGRLRLTELGRFYRDYVELMAHFDRVLPRRIHRVIYEDLVANPEAEVRKILGYLGLPFEESCLRFYETKRAVLTPSSEQVRKPISQDAVDHWRSYEGRLGPLIESLGSVFTCYPEVPQEFR
jgi:tetratricopeptide (TPR) repeat protein